MHNPLLPFPFRLFRNSISTRLLLAIGLFILSSDISWAQDQRLFRAIVRTVDNGRIDGILYDVTDPTILYVPNIKSDIALLRAGQAEILPIPVSMIRGLTIRRKSHVARGTAIGLGVGAGFALLFSATIPASNSATSIDLTNVVREILVISSLIGGTFCGAVISVVPRSGITLNGKAALSPGVKRELLRFAYHSPVR